MQMQGNPRHRLFEILAKTMAVHVFFYRLVQQLRRSPKTSIIRTLAGYSLHKSEGILKILATGWNSREQKCGHPTVLVETFVERDRFAGTSYKAANWIQLGETNGRSRQDRYSPLREDYGRFWRDSRRDSGHPFFENLGKTWVSTFSPYLITYK
jgi:hypothetical protein